MKTLPMLAVIEAVTRLEVRLGDMPDDFIRMCVESADICFPNARWSLEEGRQYVLAAMAAHL